MKTSKSNVKDNLASMDPHPLRQTTALKQMNVNT